MEFINENKILGDLIYNFITESNDLKEETYLLARFVITNSFEHIKFCREYFIINYECSLENFKLVCNTNDNYYIYQRITPHIISYDIFDTLIARKCIFPDTIFDIIAKNNNIYNFKTTRKRSECISNGTFDDIYVKFKAMSGFDNDLVNNLKQIEFQTELDNIFPIECNKIQVRPTDVFISDMYYSKDYINKLLIKCGYSGENKIYVSPKGKRLGTIWNQISEHISYHIGDNYNLDVKNALTWGHKRGIQYHYSLTLTESEKSFLNWGLIEIGYLIRYLRLSNSYLEEPYKTLYSEQVEKNIPILILFSFYINQICIKNKIKKILFTTRDCCLLSKIFAKLFPEYTNTTFHSSRHVYQNPSDDYIKYVKSIYSSDSLIVDLQGYGKSVLSFFEECINIEPNVIYLISFNTKNKKNFKYVVSGKRGNNLENINYDIIGTLKNYTESEPVRDNLEYDIKYIIPSHKAIDNCCDVINNFNIPIMNDTNIIKEYLDKLTNDLNTDILLNKVVSHKGSH